MKKLIYAIVDTKQNTSEHLMNTVSVIRGISGAGLEAVFSNSRPDVTWISAVVSDVDRKDVIPNNTNTIEYAGVIDKLFQQFPLLPMRYGSLVESNDIIEKLLERNYKEIQQNLQKVENKCEFGLKVFCDSEKLHAELRAKAEDRKSVFEDKDDEASENSIYKDYLIKKLKIFRFEELLSGYMDNIIEEITKHLVPLDTIRNFRKRPAGANILDAVFLIKKEAQWEKKDVLIHSVKELQGKYPGLSFVLSGPWPPYNFVDITLK
ncbi:MAG: GvpL/GvpF family gas vesicle protein [Ignavibacteriaceae bacterium]